MATEIEARREGNEAPAGETHWHTFGVAETAERLGTNPDLGLSSGEAARRLARHGPNAIPEQARRSALALFFAQFAEVMILILIVAAVVSGLIGDAKDMIVILVIVALNAVVGFVQEYRAEHAVAALRRLAAPAATIVRDGRHETVPTEALVPGDVVLLEAGSAIPADLRLSETVELKTSEAALTGESAAVEKTAAPLAVTNLGLGERVNIAFKGTTAVYGRGRGIVVATGARTELGKIAQLIESAPEMRTPLQQRLAVFGRQITYAVLGICAVVFAVGLLRDEPPFRILLTALSLAVAALPEALPAVVTVLLALGARKMARRKALIRRLPAVETLGSVTYICSDKTGTLTENEMRVAEVYALGERAPASDIDPGAEPLRRLFEALALCNDTGRGDGERVVGEPTEVALVRAAADRGFDKTALEGRMPRVGEMPFDSERKRMTTLHALSGADDDGFVAYAKGAPESILERCRRVATAAGDIALDPAPIAAAAEAMAADGLRVLAIADQRWPAMPTAPDARKIEDNLVLLGLVGLLDPPRAEAKAAVNLCKSAGIVPVMITGDHPATARAIARRLGIIDDDGAVLTGTGLRDLSDAALAERVTDARVYARVDPAQKIRIVEALKRRGEFVAMTGDGVNDAPALARADIGVAMGKGGTDVAREAASLVLLDDNFATIVAAVREGRRIFDNIRKFIRYAITCNSAEIWTVFLAPFLGLPVPLLPIQILWINLVTDGLPGLALAAEPAEAGVMARPPRPPKESIFAHGMWQHMVWVGLAMAALSLMTQAYAIHVVDSHWQTMVFTVLTLSQMSHVLAIRSERDSLFTQGLGSNLPLFYAVLATFVLQMLTIYVPALNPIFNTAPLTAVELGACLAVSAVVFALVEIEKALIRRGRLYAPRRAADPA